MECTAAAQAQTLVAFLHARHVFRPVERTESIGFMSDRDLKLNVSTYVWILLEVVAAVVCHPRDLLCSTNEKASKRSTETENIRAHIPLVTMI